MFVGRQPIFSADLNVFGYELLCRSGLTNQADFLDADQATSQVVMNSLVNFGLDELVGARPAFINVTKNFLLDGHCRTLPRDRFVLEILEDIDPNDRVLKELRELSEAGYTIALDDFIFCDGMQPMLEIADIVKVDLLQVSLDQAPEYLNLFKQYDLKVLAEKVETYDVFEECLALGFEYFQGYFFSHPRVISGTDIQANRMSALQLVAKVNAPDISFEELIEVVESDLTLSFKLLRFINATNCGLSRKLASVREAIVYVGLNRIKTWATLLLVSCGDGKPAQLIIDAATRAKMCELIASHSFFETEGFFTCGLLSLLDALMDQPMPEILKMLPLNGEMNAALLEYQGIYGQALQCVIQYEIGNWSAVGFGDLSIDTIRECYLKAINWSRNFAEAMSIR